MSHIVLQRDKTADQFVPNPTWKVYVSAYTQAHTRNSDLKPRNASSIQYCICYNQPKNNHKA